MSDPKRATLITVGAQKSVKNNVNKTVRLTINLDESNESKYPELNYKELIIAAARKKRLENGKTDGLDPFSDNDDDVERVARKFEQKYGGKGIYGRKGRSKYEDFADIGYGYDENDPFIDNKDGYDEMVPPECDTAYGGFYINCGSLEFKTVPENQSAISDGEPSRRNKRRISSSSSEEASSESSSESDSQEAKDPKAIANGTVDSHKTEHRKKKNKNVDMKTAKKVRRTDSSAATSGKQTSDDNGHGDAESADSRTSQSDSLTSKPAPSSENPITSDSSRDVESKVEVKLPSSIVQILEELEATSRQLHELPSQEVETKTDQFAIRIERALNKVSAEARVRRAAWARAARALRTPRAALQARANALATSSSSAQPSTTSQVTQPTTTTTTVSVATTTVTVATTTVTVATKRKADDDLLNMNLEKMTTEEKEAKIVDILRRLKDLIEERKPDMIASYNAECEKIQEERKKFAMGVVCPERERRLPKRRFPWCGRARALLCALAALAGPPAAAAALLRARALPLFPHGFVRMPTLLRQADLSKDVKPSDLKRQRIGSSSQPTPTPNPQFTEPINFPSSLTVTTSLKQPDKKEEKDSKPESNSMYGSLSNSYPLSKDLVIEKEETKKDLNKKDDLYIPPNNIGSITITPVVNQKTEKKTVIVNDKGKEGLLRVKSPAALNEMVQKKEKDKQKKPEKNHSIPKEKRIDLPLHVDTSQHNKKETPSPKEEISHKQIETMKISEKDIPRPALVPVYHSPTFAKPDRPPEVKKKKDVVIVSDLDPLADVVAPEPLAVDDSSSDVEVIEEQNTTKSDKSETVPLKDKVSVVNHKKVNFVKLKVSDNECQKREKDAVKSVLESIKELKNAQRQMDEVINNKKVNSVTPKISSNNEFRKPEQIDVNTNEEIKTLMRNIHEMNNLEDPANCNSYEVVKVKTNAKHQSSKPFSRPVFGETHSDKDKLSDFFKQNGWI